MRHTLDVAKLHLNKPQTMFLSPVYILVVVLVLSAIISLALQRAGLDSSSPEFEAGARGNMGMVWSLPGFLIYYGVQATATTLPFALALGSTRRAHVLGTAIANLILSGYITLMMVVLLWVELATNHWFVGVYALDSYALGSGNVGVLAATVFLGVFLSTCIGGAFGAVWVRYGAKGPTIVALALGLVLAVLVLAFVPQFGAILATITLAKLAAVAFGLAALCLFGTWLAMRRTAIR